MSRSGYQPLVLDSLGLGPIAHGVRAQAEAGGVVVDLSNPEHIQYLRDGGATSSGAVVNEKTAMKVAALWRGVHILAGVPGNMPLVLREKTGPRESQEATDHPAFDLVALRPCRWLTPQDFKRMLTAHVVLRGNGYAVKVRGVRGVQELWPIHPARMEPKLSDDFELSYEYTSPRGVKRTLPASEVFHVRGLTLDGVKGMGALEYARETMGLAQQGQRAAAKMWKQGTMAGGALKHPKVLSEESGDRLRRQMSERHSGAENAAKWIILEEGMEAVTLSLSAVDMQFLESRVHEMRQLAMFLGVPPHMLGDTEKSTSWGTGLEQQKDGFIAFTGEDYLTAWEQSCRRDLLTPEEARHFYFRFVRAAMIRGDIKTRYAAYKSAIDSRMMFPNEARELEDMNPRDGGDDFADQPTSAGPAPSSQEPDDEDRDPPARP